MFCCFFSHIISLYISCSFLSILGEKYPNPFSYLSAHSSASYTHTCLICVPRTVHLLMINITFWFLILKWQSFLIILFWVSFKLIDMIEWGFATLSQSIDMLQQRLISGLTSEQRWLDRFLKTKISMKAD